MYTYERILPVFVIFMCCDASSEVLAFVEMPNNFDDSAALTLVDRPKETMLSSRVLIEKDFIFVF